MDKKDNVNNIPDSVKLETFNGYNKYPFIGKRIHDTPSTHKTSHLLSPETITKRRELPY